VDVSGKRVLLVDDVSDSGDTFDVAIRHIRERSTPRELRTAVLHHKTVSRYEPDYYAHKIVKWRWLVYPWALVEDVSGFIRAMKPVPRNPREVAARLERDHDLRLSQHDLATVLAAMD
jgi:hypoxanthine phosphoribosyltransferase